MTLKKTYILMFFASSLALLCASCNKEFKSSDYTAYFGGEVTNPTNSYVLFCRDSQVIDTLKLDKNNRFFIKFDSLTPGLYSFRHEPEYQYVYFDKNDSLMVSINSRDFDNSIVFSGRGDQKNNFLMEVYLSNEKDREHMFMVYDNDINTFNKTIDSKYARNQKFYDAKKEEIQWSEDFGVFAKASIDFPYYSKKELYPIIHQSRTGNDVIETLPKNYYTYRRKIDFNNAELSDYAPFVKYLTHMLNNVASINYHNHFTEADLSLKTNINKLNIADTLIKNEKIKNTILNNIAFTYLLEDQNMVNNQKFLETYHKYSTDRSQKNEITKIGNAIQLLKAGNPLPNVKLYDINGNMVSSDSLINKSTVIFFWTQKATTHLIEAHKKVLAFKKQYPNYHFVAVNLDDNQDKWKQVLANFKFDGITELRTADFEDLRIKWAITKIHRTIILSPNGTINNAFTNLFDNNFEDNLK
jgi:hypothetical protein